MILCLIAFLIAVFFPLFVSSWRGVFFGIALQSFCTALFLFSWSGAHEVDIIVRLVEIISLRCIVAPTVFWMALKKIGRPRGFELIPANLVTWILAGVLLILAGSLGRSLYPEDLVRAFHITAVASSLLAGLFILSVQVEPLGQMIGLLYIEGAITLFETLGHRGPWFLQAGASLIFLWLLALMASFTGKFVTVETSDGEDSAAGWEVL